MFVFSLKYVEKHEQRSSDLSLINEKYYLVRDPQQIASVMLIQWIILQKKTLRIMNFESRDSYSNLLFKSKN